jgi:hypothetical protein
MGGSSGFRGLLVIVAGLALVTVACSAEGGGDAANPTSSPPRSITRPAGPVADLSEGIPDKGGAWLGTPDGLQPDGTYRVEFDEPGYVEEEFVAAGTATAYVADDQLPSDGRWDVAEGESADYRTRVVVRRPADPANFSGVVVAEWFNVSGGVDADPEWTTVHEEIVRQGHVWVGVSAQITGVEGGPVRFVLEVPGSEFAGQGLKNIDPERYATLVHPGDSFSYDIYTQIARALREGSGLDGLEPTAVIAAGESQSAAGLVTYINAAQPRTKAFDGFFVHSRGSSGLPIPGAGESVDIASSIGRTPSIIRTDTDVPVLVFQAEGDVGSFLSSVTARQPDSDTFRLWELAGSPHADLNLIGETTETLLDCGVDINHGPMHIVAKAALRQLVDWVVDGEPPPEAPRLEVTEGDEPEIRRDEDGIALGGVRTPPLEVPVEVLSAEPGPSDEMICIAVGSTRPLSQERLAARYASSADYEEQFAASVDAAIEAGYVLEDDRASIEAYARPDLIPSG